jgi:hypothetical protein
MMSLGDHFVMPLGGRFAMLRGNHSVMSLCDRYAIGMNQNS